MPLEELAGRLFAGGCRWLSLREKDLTPAERRALLQRIVALGAKWRAVVTIHDDVEAAAAVGAAGVHLPADGSIAAARRALGNDKLIGQSAHDPRDFVAAADQRADYVTFSPIFLSASKPGYGPALGLSALSRPWPLPVIALGGIDETNIGACLPAGASGVAIMGAAMRAAAPEAFMAGLLARFGPNLAAERGDAHSR